MTALVLTNKPLTSLSSGYDLRVWHLCRHLAERENLVSVCLPLQAERGREYAEESLNSSQLFREEVRVPEGSLKASSLRRHLRWREDRFFPWGFPRFHREVIETIRGCAERHRVERFLVFGSDLAGFMLAFRRRKVLFDICDSVVLTEMRESAYKPGSGLGERLRRRLMLERWKRTEGRLPHWFSEVTTISEVDSAMVRALAGKPRNVTTVPNGLDPRLQQLPACAIPRRRGVVFWGNLSFPPNREAMRYFFEAVYGPHLSGRGIECCVVGRNPEPWLRRLSNSDPSVRVLGYVPDIQPIIADYPVLINPMVIGSGMKNKVLEAFALGMGVVSTPLGMEGVPDAVDGTHYIGASTPEAIAQAVIALLGDRAGQALLGRRARDLVMLRYTWSAVAAQWLKLYESM